MISRRRPHTQPSAAHGWSSHDLYRVTEASGGYALVRIPKDATGGVYEIISDRTGYYAVYADQTVPLAVYAPNGWRPAPMDPPAPVYFRVPDAGGRIHFEKPAQLFTPSGALFQDGAELSGWVALPGSQPGLWRFESRDPGLVQTQDLPGFFAQGDPASYLEHEIE